MRRPQVTRGFTLVELLVVIGIIALLISILLPALNSARRAANQTKCAAQMKQMHNACLLYAQDNRGYWPTVRVQTIAATGAGSYDLYDFTFGTSASVYWYDFLSKYLTKTKLGVQSTNGGEADSARKSIIWGCPAFDGYVTGAAYGGINRSQTGFGMNQWPTFKPDTLLQADTLPSLLLPSNISQWSKPIAKTEAEAADGAHQAGKFYPATTWGRQGANRMLVTDARLYFAESRAAPLDGTFPEQPFSSASILWTSGIDGQTQVDIYRHGKPAPIGSKPQTFSNRGGKVGYNILYCDGHVAQCNDQRPAYESVRQRYPG